MMRLRPVVTPTVVVSADNPRFRGAQDLVQSSRERRKREQTFIEGIHLCKTYLDRGGHPSQVFVTEAALQNPEVAALWPQLRADRVILTPALFRELSQVEHGVALAFVIDTPRIELPEQISSTAVYLDRVQDPGNVGSILRCCAAAGVGHLITSPGTAFCWAPKVLRAAMGAHFLLSIHEGVSWSALQPRIQVPVIATSGVAGQNLWESDLRGPCVWLFGNEGAGLAPEITLAAKQQVAIPLDPRVESLNVAAAVAIVLFEQRRQQQLQAGH